VAQHSHKDAANAIKIAFAVLVPIIETVGLVDDQRLFEKFGHLPVIEEGALYKLGASCIKRHGIVSRNSMVANRMAG
jgi:hypothetical protein